ncbi:aminoglycoside phosphotransferase family protein [Hyphomonas sp. WL0036]|uniref:aminoglycoside phosphotransferase family protein n=1 Tax=Hyphomonas sediminis TaxID=2866160 RepID=UPI001C802AA2|nr:aminoglycoside phosphotransferase family protein [Hyphomonas sediminis]MBY9066873.1 aminoglycoside phosphotransferase family protein [Hyphomonas sediminis]
MAEEGSAISLDPAIAARLIVSRFPELSGEKITPLPAEGTDNHIFRIGAHLCARFPKVPWAVATARREAAVLPRFSASPVAVPGVYGIGDPGGEYPHHWSVLSWLPGEPLGAARLADPERAARELAAFFGFLRAQPVDADFRYGAENNWRGGPLALRAEAFDAALARLPNVDAGWAQRLWSAAVEQRAPGAQAWLHGDVHPGNILTVDGSISGIIDWGICGVGDAACDLLSAWAVFDAPARSVFRAALGASDEEWLRGAGWALSMAVIYLPYAYENGLRSDMSERMLARLKEEFG